MNFQVPSEVLQSQQFLRGQLTYQEICLFQSLPQKRLLSEKNGKVCSSPTRETDDLVFVLETYQDVGQTFWRGR